ncbi:hypothetical protein SPI_07609 [Niveomyces insectorum RCEF 264]|uniref:Transcription factor c2h2 n=1 Tax=Niveomyces insectorum RCEF 264 TaxID=1081102 RepID=A0A167PFF0_9HYPO|nr:hypothetical protein SPI_07609 [Niveomyces insectorum RCEF 264]
MEPLPSTNEPPLHEQARLPRHTFSSSNLAPNSVFFGAPFSTTAAAAVANTTVDTSSSTSISSPQPSLQTPAPPPTQESSSFATAVPPPPPCGLSQESITGPSRRRRPLPPPPPPPPLPLQDELVAAAVATPRLSARRQGPAVSASSAPVQLPLPSLFVSPAPVFTPPQPPLPSSTDAAMLDANTTFLGHDLTAYASDTSLSPPTPARSITASPPRPRLGLTPQQRELKRQRDQVRRDAKAASRRHAESAALFAGFDLGTASTVSSVSSVSSAPFAPFSGPASASASASAAAPSSSAPVASKRGASSIHIHGGHGPTNTAATVVAAASLPISSSAAAPASSSLATASSFLPSPSPPPPPPPPPSPPMSSSMGELGGPSSSSHLPSMYATSGPSHLSLLSEPATSSSSVAGSMHASTPYLSAGNGAYSPSMQDHTNQGVFPGSYQAQPYLSEYTTSTFSPAAPPTIQSQYSRSAMHDQQNLMYHMPPPGSSLLGAAGHMPHPQQAAQHSQPPHPQLGHAGLTAAAPPPLHRPHHHATAQHQGGGHHHQHHHHHHHPQHPQHHAVYDAAGLGDPTASGSPGVRVVQGRPKPQCWEHGCNGRQFSTFSNLLRHQREKSGQAAKAVCPNCGAEFTRTTARNGHLQHDKCKQRRNA